MFQLSPPQYVEDNLGVMSVGFLLSKPDDAVIWRGPKKNGNRSVFEYLLTHIHQTVSHRDVCTGWARDYTHLS